MNWSNNRNILDDDEEEQDTGLSESQKAAYERRIVEYDYLLSQYQKENRALKAECDRLNRELVRFYEIDIENNKKIKQRETAATERERELDEKQEEIYKINSKRDVETNEIIKDYLADGCHLRKPVIEKYASLGLSKQAIIKRLKKAGVYKSKN